MSLYTYYEQCILDEIDNTHYEEYWDEPFPGAYHQSDQVVQAVASEGTDPVTALVTHLANLTSR